MRLGRQGGINELKEKSCKKAAILQSIYRDIWGEPADATVLRRLMGGIQSGSGRELKHFHQIQAAYQQYKIEHFCIDFDDMITLALDILTSNDAAKRRVREEYQEKFTFIQGG